MSLGTTMQGTPSIRIGKETLTNRSARGEKDREQSPAHDAVCRRTEREKEEERCLVFSPLVRIRNIRQSYRIQAHFLSSFCRHHLDYYFFQSLFTICFLITHTFRFWTSSKNTERCTEREQSSTSDVMSL